MGLDALEAVGTVAREALPHAQRARLFGFLPHDAAPSPWERDRLAGLFGFREVVLPCHQHHEREVHVLQMSIVGGAAVPPELTGLALKQTGIWHHAVRNRRIARLARALQDDDVETLQTVAQSSFALLRVSPVLARARRRILVLVESVEHGLALADLLPDWPLVPGPLLNMAGLRERERQRLERGKAQRWEEWPAAIVTFAALKSLPLADVDIIVRADGGNGLPPMSMAKRTQPNDRPLSPLLLIDFDDRHQDLLRQRSRKRREAYTARGWHAPGTDKVQIRVEEFLASRPKGVKA